MSARAPPSPILAVGVLVVVFVSARLLTLAWALPVALLAAAPLLYGLVLAGRKDEDVRDITLGVDGEPVGVDGSASAASAAAGAAGGAASASRERRKRTRRAADGTRASAAAGASVGVGGASPAPQLPIIVEATSAESVPRFLTANTREPIAFENKFFRGHVLIKVITEPVDPHFAAYFALGRRAFEIQVQGQFKRLPTGTLYMGVEVPKRLNLGFFARTAGKMVLGIAKSLVRGLHSSFGVADESEAPHIVFPMTMSVDRLVVTGPGETPPPLGVPMLPGTDEENAARRRAARLDDTFSLESTYTLSFHSANLDLVQWRATKIPGVSDLDLRTFVVDQPIKIVAYHMGPGDFSSTPHLNSAKDYVLAFQFSHTGGSVVWPDASATASASLRAAVGAGVGAGAGAGAGAGGDDDEYYSDGETAADAPVAARGLTNEMAAAVGPIGSAARATASSVEPVSSAAGAAAAGASTTSGKGAIASVGGPIRLPILDVTSLSVPACLECSLGDQLRAVVYVVQVEGLPRGVAGASTGSRELLGSPSRPRMLSELESAPRSPSAARGLPTGAPGLSTSGDRLSGIGAVASTGAATSGAGVGQGAGPAGPELTAVDEVLAYEYAHEVPFSLDAADADDEFDGATSVAMGRPLSPTSDDDGTGASEFADESGAGAAADGSHPPWRLVSPGPLRSTPLSTPKFSTPREQADEPTATGASAASAAPATMRFSVLRTYRDFVELDEALRGSGLLGATAPKLPPAASAQPLSVDAQRAALTALLCHAMSQPAVVASRAWQAFLFSLGRADLRTLHAGHENELRVAVPGRAPVVREGVVARALWDSLWREESLVLTETTLSFFAAGSKKPVSVVPLFEIMAAERMPLRASPFAGFAFVQLETPARIHYLCVREDDEAGAWIDAITRVRARAPADGDSTFVYRGPGAADDARRVVLNARRMVFALTDAERAVGACALGEELLTTVLRLSPDSPTETVTAFLDRLALLEHVRVDALTHAERAAFGLNVFHTLLTHALLVLGAPSSVIGRKNFYSRISYAIAGHELSLFELQHSVLRAAMTPPKQLADLFLPSFGRSRGKAVAVPFALASADVRLNFAINMGTTSNLQGIAVFVPATLDAQLDAVAMMFAAQFVAVSEPKGVVTLPRVCQWYARDFGTRSGDKFDALRGMLSFVPRDEYDRLGRLLAREAGVTIKYHAFSSMYWPRFIRLDV